MNKPPRHHGSAKIGRALVLGGLLLVLSVNALVFRSAFMRPHPSTLMELSAAIIAIWMMGGAAGLCLRYIWGRYLVLFFLSAGMVWFAFGAVLMEMEHEPYDIGMPSKLLLAAVIYLPILLVLSYSRHVRRLTSRAWD